MANGNSTPQERGHAAVPRDTQPSEVNEPWQSPGYWTSPPLTDPTRLTTNAVDRATAQWEQRLLSEIQIIVQRLEAMDQATKLNAEHIKSIPAEAEKDLAHAREDIDRQILALRELVKESAKGINERIEVLVKEYSDIPVQRERAITIARELFEARLQNVQDVATEKFHAIEGQFASNALALTAALAAQKEAAAEQNKSNTLAIAKSEQATKETIAANAAQTIGSIVS